MIIGQWGLKGVKGHQHERLFTNDTVTLIINQGFGIVSLAMKTNSQGRDTHENALFILNHKIQIIK